MTTQLLTASRMSSFLACPRKHYWRYEVGLKRDTDAKALRVGTAWHSLMEARWQGADYEAAIANAIPADLEFEEIDVATITGLLAGYYARYGESDEVVTELFAETEFNLPLPGSRTFNVAGKIDGIAQLSDGRLCLLEHKTTGDSVEPDSEYWLRLRFNPQILQYVLAAKALGWDIETVIYDVTRKPSIRQKKTESIEEYGDRLAQDTKDRPEFYFARREVPVLHDDIAEFEAQRLVVGRNIMFSQREERKAEKPWQAWPRNIDMMTCRMCEFSQFCLQNTNPDPEVPPAGFTKGTIHDELETATETK